MDNVDVLVDVGTLVEKLVRLSHTVGQLISLMLKVLGALKSQIHVTTFQNRLSRPQKSFLTQKALVN